MASSGLSAPATRSSIATARSCDVRATGEIAALALDGRDVVEQIGGVAAVVGIVAQHLGERARQQRQRVIVAAEVEQRRGLADGVREQRPGAPGRAGARRSLARGGGARARAASCLRPVRSIARCCTDAAALGARRAETAVRAARAPRSRCGRSVGVAGLNRSYSTPTRSSSTASIGGDPPSRSIRALQRRA